MGRCWFQRRGHGFWILLPAVSAISQRRPDYIKSLNLALRLKPAVQRRGLMMGFTRTVPRVSTQEFKIDALKVVKGRRCLTCLLDVKRL